MEDNVIAKLDSLVGSLFCAGPASEQAVMKAEVRLGLLFPPSYRAFLLHYGAAFGGGLEIYGLDSNLKLGEIPQWSNVVESTIALRPDSLPGDSIQISHSGVDSGFFLHCSRSIKNYEGHVIAWGPEHGSNGKKYSIHSRIGCWPLISQCIRSLTRRLTEALKAWRSVSGPWCCSPQMTAPSRETTLGLGRCELADLPVASNLMVVRIGG